MVSTSIEHLLGVKNVKKHYVPIVTGPEATKIAMVSFVPL